jgi:hypothetical protein
MSFTQVIKRADRVPLGPAEEVKARLDEAFPGMRYVRIDKSPELPLPRWSWLRLLLWLHSPRYPHWESHFEGEQFIAEFKFDDSRIVQKITVTLYGRGTTGANAYFARLSSATGWELK